MAQSHGHEAEKPAGGPRVIGQSGKVRVVALEPEPMGAERMFLPGVLKGLGVTARHFFRNVLMRKDTVTVQYPEEKDPYPPRFRGVHRLMKREDGSVRCVACMLCPTVCPAHCITIEPGEREDSNEKYPLVFEIDELRCVVCGLCVEACPCDAIRMDTGVHMHPSTFRGEGVLQKVDLLKRGELSTATQGGKGEEWDEKDAVPERTAESRVPAAPR
jgi:NADH-quinone oxidoreductase subunit I